MSEISKRTDKLLIVEPDEQTGQILFEFLDSSYDCEVVKNGGEAFRLLTRESFSVVLSNFDLSTTEASNFISTVKSLSPHTAIILICEHISADDAIKSFRAGATDFVQKPFKLEEVETSVNKGFSQY